MIYSLIFETGLVTTCSFSSEDLSGLTLQSSGKLCVKLFGLFNKTVSLYRMHLSLRAYIKCSTLWTLNRDSNQNSIQAELQASLFYQDCGGGESGGGLMVSMQ